MEYLLDPIHGRLHYRTIGTIGWKTLTHTETLKMMNRDKELALQQKDVIFGMMNDMQHIDVLDVIDWESQQFRIIMKYYDFYNMKQYTQDLFYRLTSGLQNGL